MARRVATRISLEGVQQVVAGFKKAGDAAKGFRDRVKQSVGEGLDYVSKNSQHIESIGKGFATAGALAAGGLMAVTKAAMDWESAWAGVQKTVDGDREQMAALESDLRTLAKTMPSAHREIAGVAEAAGQLGIQRENVAAFTKTMIQLGETTNLSAETAATSMAQFMNIMGTSQSQVSRMGAAIVALGNDGASTEADIMALGQRLAATGNQMGLSEADVLAYANAMASVGIEAEAGGTAMSMSWKDIDRAVREGGKSLETIARVSGMTADEFSQAWGVNAAGATASFIEGLGGMSAGGEDVNKILSELGMTGIRQSDTMLRLAGATKAAGASNDLLRDSLELGKQAWADNSALAEEYAKRAETAESKAQVAWNNIKDAAISTGQAMLPVVSQIAEAVSGVAQAFGAMDEGAQVFTLGALAVVAAAGLGVGGLTKLITSAAAAKTALRDLGLSAKTASLSMGAIGLALTAASLAMAHWISQQAEAKALADDYAQAIRDQGAAVGELTRAVAAQKLEDDGALVAAKALGISYDTLTDAIQGNKAAYDEVTEAIDKTRAANVDFSDGLNPYLNAADKVEESLKANAKAHADGVKEQERYAEVVGESADASETDAAAKMSQAQAIAEQEQALRTAIASTQEYSNMLLALSGSQIGVEASFAAMNGLLAENGQNFDISTEAGRDNRQAINQAAAANMKLIESMIESGASHAEVAEKAAELKARFMEMLGPIENVDESILDLIESAHEVPPEIVMEVTAPGAVASKAETDAFLEALKQVPKEVGTKLWTLWDSGDYNAALEALKAENGKEYRNYMYTVYHAVYEGSTRGGVTVDADGSVKEYYARGGLRERHVAQIAPANTIRVWAEPETEGEAYIPLAGSKRSRSTSILAEVADRFGYELVRRFADGDVVGGMSAAPQWAPVAPAARGREVELTIAPQFPQGVDYQQAMRQTFDEAAHQFRGYLNARR